MKSCEPCIEVKSVPPSVDLHPLMWPSRPWKCIHVDFVGPISDKTYLVVVDGYSKWPEVWENDLYHNRETIMVLSNLFTLYGLPDQLMLDNGP